MSRAFLFMGLAFSTLLVACQAPQNSVSQDPVAFARERGSVGSAMAVLARNCVTCHKTFGTWSESDFRTKLTKTGRNWVVAGDLGASALYQKLRGVSASGNMPPAGPISEEERSTLAVWILNLKPIPAPVPSTSPVPTPEPVECAAATRWKGVQRVLAKNDCLKCHDEFDTPDAEFYQNYFAGRSVDQSRIFETLRGVSPNGEMPPPPRKPMPAEDVQVLRDWAERHPTGQSDTCN
jgi:mono/diheme cytochrome c family protein